MSGAGDEVEVESVRYSGHLQKDRPETPPQKQTADSQEEDNAVTGSVEREASPSTASEGSVPKKAKLA